jgi:alkylation response protein AidB-like acyl-CoA dehydrogenase
MCAEQVRQVSEEESRKVAEESRETEWRQPSFMGEMFLGNFRFDLIHPYPERRLDRPEFVEFYATLQAFLRDEVDPVAIDETGEYPDAVIQGLRELGAFGLKIPKEYSGLGFDQNEYAQVMELIGSYDGNLMALLSAHQSIGVPQPIKLFGSEELKEKYLPRCARGAISAFALTEPEVGSDPARLATTAVLDGDDYVLNGMKLWCTNGTIAELLVVMAMEPDSKKISVRVPRENLIGKEGRGLKIALTTLNDGRLSIPNGCLGQAKLCLRIVRQWASQRVQWGLPIGRHEAIAQKISDIAATTFAMESIVKLASDMANRGDRDLRLEAAACKEWNTDRSWQIIDETMQIRGGRGYECESSLAARGEEPWGVERMMRDSRINRIFEGSSEVMHLIMAREAVDKHLQVAGSLVDPKTPIGKKLAALPKVALFYAAWYPTRWLGWGRWPRFADFGDLATHLRFVERRCRKLARESFHGMLVHQAALERKQGFLFRLVDIVNELFAMSASVSRATAMQRSGDERGAEAVKLADVFCRSSRRRVDELFRALWRNEDPVKYSTARSVMDGDFVWMENLLEGTEASGLAAAQASATGAAETSVEPVAATS